MVNDESDSSAAPAPGGHVPVLLREVIEYLRPAAGEVVLDCTAGRGGHAAALIDRLAPQGHYIGLDADPANVAHVQQRFVLGMGGVKVDVLHRNFAAARQALDELGIDRVNVLLADLGFASSQVDDPARGFSFRAEGPLDMRLDPTRGPTAADLVNSLDERELADVIYQFGEERFSRRIAQKIVARRRVEPITTTGQLADLCAAAYGHRRHASRIDPATRTFQALRIAVNDELNRLTLLLEQLPELLATGGRALIISFHSLEDRMVKHAFRDWAKAGRVRLLTKKPLTAGEMEIAANPRSRSAKARAIEWIGGTENPASHTLD